MYIVYNIKTTDRVESFEKVSSARRSTTCKNRNAGEERFAYADSEYYYNHVVHKIKVKSLMTGAEVEIDSNTPLCCDPSSETFWSM